MHTPPLSKKNALKDEKKIQKRQISQQPSTSYDRNLETIASTSTQLQPQIASTYVHGKLMNDCRYSS